MNDKLKTCPFCGGEAKILKINDCGRTVVGCDNGNKCNMLCDNTVEDAISKWNNRPVEDDLRLKIEKLEDDIHCMKIDYHMLKSNHELVVDFK